MNVPQYPFAPPIDFNHCFARWQIPRAGQTSLDARVTQTVWAQTSTDFVATVRDMNDIANGNSPLWLSGNSALLYAGIYRCRDIPMTPQYGLDSDAAVLSIILPSGLAKLRKVSDDGLLSQDESRRVGPIFGITLIDEGHPLVPRDYAYIPNRYPSGEGLKKEFRDWSAHWETGDRTGSINMSAFDGESNTVQICFTGLWK
ncbi:hypothetical protein BKA65DRAFT_27886 [Rhexocercosporidium sp. MPI-PUGE-AT-0058]|nr:hypothetical protein BKA65DRAFT_27886 [Rhexocercosporidium sp. MPI-PUGE-AT-0058]